MGAWIETSSAKDAARAQLSHPTWVRGLKHDKLTDYDSKLESHPTWVRGLKLAKNAAIQLDEHVAPYVGAWIET